MPMSREGVIHRVALGLAKHFARELRDGSRISALRTRCQPHAHRRFENRKLKEEARVSTGEARVSTGEASRAMAVVQVSRYAREDGKDGRPRCVCK